ncbi:MAG: tRNA lysidine(34) synthetase TilS, partial [Chitinophagia bacterium]|nr:tRNA lysidine(34) synthetase TilS [Chitinophagia bacterium]
QRGGSVLAITIDHQLRVESADEAAQVKTWCTQKNIPHETLRWEKETAPTSALHDQARNARYDLLIEACKKNNIDYLFLGHHADDQAETVLMRFMKGSGVDGLAAMPRLRDAQGVTLYRPLLPVSKQMLEDTCAAHGWAFVRDPSNQSLKYNRGRLRSLAAPLAAEGLTTATLYETARHAGIARAAFEIITNAWLRQHASVNLFGIITLDGTAWKKLDDEQKRRALIRALLTTSGEDYPPRNASLDTLIQNLSTHATINQTLSGCRIALQNETLHIYREEAALPTPMPLENNMLWDNRFKIICDPSLLDQDLVVAPLGNHSRNTLEKMHLKQVAEYPATQ